MAKRPEDRYQTAVEMQRDLERVRVGDPVTVAGPLPSQQTTQAIGAAGYGESATTVLGGGSTVAGGRAARYGDDVAEPRRSSVGWVLAAILALVVVGFAAFLITRALTSPNSTTGTTITAPTDTTLPATTATTATTTTQPTTTSKPETTAQPTTTKQQTTTSQPTTTTQPTTTSTSGGTTTSAP